jgi:hypothetical protein
VRFWLLALAGCQKLLDLEQVPDPPDASPPPPPCVMPLLSDSFDTDPPCGPIGFADDDPTTTTTSENGRLAIHPGTTMDQTRGGCIGSKMAFTAESGVFMHVTTLPDGSEYQDLVLDWVGSTMVTTVSWNASDIIVQDGTTTFADTLFDPAKTTWVRVRPSDDGTAIQAETSADGLDWNMFGTDPIVPPASVGILFHGGTFAMESAPRTIYFDDLNVCPL